MGVERSQSGRSVRVAVGRQQVAGGPFFLWRESSFHLAARPSLERYSSFCGAGYVRNYLSGFSRLPIGDFASRVEPRTAIVIFGGNRRSAAVRTLYGAAEARCRGRGKLGGRNLDAGWRGVGSALTGAEKVCCLDQVCLNARLDTHCLESR